MEEVIISHYHFIHLLPISKINYNENFKDFEKLQYAILAQLQILKIRYAYPRVGLLIKFLEINGRNLKELCLGETNYLVNLAIAKFCTNLRKHSTVFLNNELETLKMV